jgi:hypothetical protein
VSFVDRYDSKDKSENYGEIAAKFKELRNKTGDDMIANERNCASLRKLSTKSLAEGIASTPIESMQRNPHHNLPATCCNRPYSIVITVLEERRKRHHMVIP